MITLWPITAIALGICASLDGYSTDRFVKISSYVEVDPIMVFVYGTDRPTTFDVFFKGGLVITGELLAALALSHFFPRIGDGACFVLLTQAVVHVIEFIRNMKIKKGA